MKLSWFVSINLIILVGIVHVFHWAKYNYSDRDVLQAQVRALTKKLHQSNLNQLALADKFEGFQQEIAAIIPEHLNKRGTSPQGYSLRSLASVTQSPRGIKRETSKEALANALLTSAKESFSSGKFKTSISLLKKFVDQN